MICVTTGKVSREGPGLSDTKIPKINGEDMLYPFVSDDLRLVKTLLLPDLLKEVRIWCKSFFCDD